MASFFEQGTYTQANAWNPTSEPQKLSKAEIESIDSIMVRDNAKLGNKQVVFFMKNKEVKTMTLSPYCEQYKAGTKLRKSSIEITELTDGENTIYRASGEEA